MIIIMAKDYTTPSTIKGKNYHCTGCGHSIVIKLLAELIDEMELREKTVFVRGVGCCSMTNRHFMVDTLHSSHGKTCACATGVARGLPDVLTISYQGDGDAYDIGFAETFNAGYRNENIVNIVVLNTLFAMTGGQMSHTTLIGQRTESCTDGRDPEATGYPLRYPEMVKEQLPHAYFARGAVWSPIEVRKTKELIRKAFNRQLNKEGYSMVEVMIPCPTNFKMTPLESIEWLQREASKTYTLGIIQEGAPKGFIPTFNNLK